MFFIVLLWHKLIKTFRFFRTPCTVIFLAVNGGYGEWTAWSSCDKTCGPGVQVRERTCTNPRPSKGGKDCEALGAMEEVRKCQLDVCGKNDYV